MNLLFPGAKVFPLQPGSKIPYAGFKWKELASDDVNAIAHWEQEYPRANWGMATGEASGVTVVDVDSEVAKDALLDVLQAKKLMDLTPAVVSTPRGWHLYFTYTPELKQTTGLIEGVDVRNDGGYVLVPPSTGYEALGALTPLPPVPPSILAISLRRSSPEVPASDGEGVPIGSRNDYLMRIASSMRRYGTPSGAVEETLLALNQSALDAPLSDTEVLNIARSVSNRYGAADDILEDPAAVPIAASDYKAGVIEYLKTKDQVRGMTTGMMGLDDLLGGGFRPTELTGLNAPAKAGKSTFLHYLIEQQLKRDIPVGYASRELDPQTEVIPDLLTLRLAKNIRKDVPSDAVLEREIDAIGQKLMFTSGFGLMELDDIATWTQTLSQEYGVKLFFFDHLHQAIDDAEDFRQVSRFIRRLKTLAMKLKVHYVVVVQPPNLAEGQELSLTTLRGGASIGQALNNLLTFERQADLKNVTKLSLKATRGKLAKRGFIHLEYDTETFGFREVRITEAAS